MQPHSQPTRWTHSLTWINSKLSHWWPHSQPHPNVQPEPQHGRKQTHFDRVTQQARSGSRSKEKSKQQELDPKMKVLAKLRSGNLDINLQNKMKRITDYFGAKETQDSAKPCDLLCPVCLQFLARPVLTACGHNFCMCCLDETLLFKPDCPSCRNYLRGSKIIECESLAKIVMRIVHKYGPEQTETHLNNLRECDEWLMQRNLRAEDIGVGLKIDVRDTEYIWCRAVIKEVYDSHCSQTTSILIHYIGWNPIYDEIIQTKNSDRLAKAGFYTGRTELPHYRATENQEQRMYSYVINSSNDSEFLLGEFAMMNGQIGMAGVGGVGGFSFDILGLGGHNANLAQESNLLEDIEQQSDDDEHDAHHNHNIPLSFDFAFDLDMHLHEPVPYIQGDLSFGSFTGGDNLQQQNRQMHAHENRVQYVHNEDGYHWDETEQQESENNRNHNINMEGMMGHDHGHGRNFMNNLENIELELQEYNVHLASLMSEFRIAQPNITKQEIVLYDTEHALNAEPEEQEKQTQANTHQQSREEKDTRVDQLEHDMMVYALLDPDKNIVQPAQQNPQQADDVPEPLI